MTAPMAQPLVRAYGSRAVASAASAAGETAEAATITDGDSGSAGHVGGGSDDDSLEEASRGDLSPTRWRRGAGASRQSTLPARAASAHSLASSSRRAPSVCSATAYRQQCRVGSAFPSPGISLGLTTDALSHDESGALRRAVDRGIDGLGLLRHPADQLAVKLATSEQLVREVQAARALPAITPPAPDAQAWACPRCDKVYMKMQYARQHASNADCKPKRVRRVPTCRGRGTPPGHGEEAPRNLAGAGCASPAGCGRAVTSAAATTSTLAARPTRRASPPGTIPATAACCWKASDCCARQATSGTRSSTVPTRRAKVKVKVMCTACVVGRATAAWPKVQAAARRGGGTVARPSFGVGGRAAAAVPSRRAR
jgi:hypothetical protein